MALVGAFGCFAFHAESLLRDGGELTLVHARERRLVRDSPRGCRSNIGSRKSSNRIAHWDELVADPGWLVTDPVADVLDVRFGKDHLVHVVLTRVAEDAVN